MKRDMPCMGAQPIQGSRYLSEIMRRVMNLLAAVIVLYCAPAPACSSEFGQSVDPAYYAQVILQVPYGIKNSSVENSTGLVAQNSDVESLFIIESYNPTPLDVDLRVEIPKPLAPKNTIEAVEIKEENDKYILHAKFRLVTEFDDWYKLVNIRIPAGTNPGTYSIKAEARFTGMIEEQHRDFVLTQQARVKVVTPVELKSLLTVPMIKLPADIEGNFDEKYAENSLLLRSNLGIFGKIFGSGDVDDVVPVSFVGVKMQNYAGEDAIALVSWDVLDPITKKEVTGFTVPQEFLEHHGGGEERIYSQVFVPGGEAIKFALPVFADRNKVLPGCYLGKVNVKLFGSDATVQTKYFNLTVQKITWASISVTLYAIVVTLIIGIFLLAKHRTIFRRFKTRWLILIALFGTAKFLLSLLPKYLLTEFFNGLLGPFAIFATGLIREGITYLFIMALVVLIPRPGVVTLSMLMSMVLSCLLGSFNPVFFLFMIVAISTIELALYLTGFTCRQDQNFTRTKKALFLAAVGLGIANAFATFVDLNLYMLLYRLYYAEWYVWASIIIVGFGYTAIAAPLGVMLGNKLKRVATE